MKRLQVSVCFLLVVLVVPCNAQSKSQPETKASILELCFKLWKQTNFGWNEKKTERAAWIIRDSDGVFQWVDWDFRDEHRAATWKGPVPQGVIAQIHTHPAFDDPRPSKQDVRVAREIKAPVYTVSGQGIWKVSPGGKITKEANDKWFGGIKEPD